MEMDFLERTAERLGISPQDLFREICEMSDVTAGRMDMFWSAYQTEKFIPEFIHCACYKICLGTVFPERS